MNNKSKFISLLLVALFGASYSSANNTKTLTEANTDENLVVRHVLRQNAANEEGTIINETAAPAANNLVSDVLAQVNAPLNGKVSMRFVAGIDTYTYTNAQFNITLKDAEGAVVKAERSYSVSSAYVGVEADGEVRYAADLFGEGYNYLIAYTLNDIPEDYWNYKFDVTASIGETGSLTTSANVNTKVAASMLDYNLKVNLVNVDGTNLGSRYEKVVTDAVYTYNAPSFDGLVASHDYVKGYLTEDDKDTVTIYYSEVDTWDGTSVSTSLSGAGTSANPYLIQSAADLAYLDSLVTATGDNLKGKFYKMTKSIDLNNNSMMIGTYTGYSARVVFSGTFDGNNCSIRGLKLDENVMGVGLFHIASSGTLKNLSVYGQVNNKKTYTGGVVGYLAGKIENCTNYTTVTASSYFQGGVVGYNEGSTGKILSCVNYGDVTGASTSIGGVVGCNKFNLDGCINFGSVKGASTVGGVVGGDEQAAGSVTNSVNYGSVTATSEAANNGGSKTGGVVGNTISPVTNCTNYGVVNSLGTSGGVVGNTTVEVSNCVNYGLMTGTWNVGGVVGNTTAKVSYCINNGDVKGTSTHIGGVVGGSTSTIDNCENNGNVSGSSWGYGGIAGSCTGDITGCTNNGDVTAAGQIGGIVGKLQSATAKVSNNVNTGNITGTNNSSVAGIVGNITVAGYTEELKTILTTTNTNSGVSTGADIHGTIS